MRRIEWSADGVRLTADGARCAPQRAIVAVPATLAGRIAYDPPLPGYRDQLTQRVPMGAVIKCFAIYDEPFWRAEGLSGSTVSGSGPLTLTVDNSPPAGSPGILVGFLEGDHARSFGRVPAAERRAAVLANLVQLLGPARGPAGGLHREELGRGGVEPRLLRGLHAARSADRVRAGAARADRPDPLGRHRDRDEVERLHRRRAAVGRARGRAKCWTGTPAAELPAAVG